MFWKETSRQTQVQHKESFTQFREACDGLGEGKDSDQEQFKDSFTQYMYIKA
jgi:hypothetical protein